MSVIINTPSGAQHVHNLTEVQGRLASACHEVREVRDYDSDAYYDVDTEATVYGRPEVLVLRVPSINFYTEVLVYLAQRDPKLAVDLAASARVVSTAVVFTVEFPDFHEEA